MKGLAQTGPDDSPYSLHCMVLPSIMYVLLMMCLNLTSIGDANALLV